MLYDLIIVGGGPAGIFSAIFAGNKGLKVLLLEKNKKLGKKLLIAGSGKCNLTHTGDYKEFIEKYGENGKFLKKALYNFKPSDMIKFFQDNGLYLVKNENGKYFPHTFKSQDVLDLLLNLCKKAGVKILTENEVHSIESFENFEIKTINDKFVSKNVLITTGGLSFPQTGSDGAGYKFSKNLGHSLEDTKPCLTPIFVNDYNFSDLSGIAFYNISMMIIRDNKKLMEKTGDMLFTHKNLSGPLIIDNSRYIKKGDILSFNFVSMPYEKFNNNLLDKIGKYGTKSVKNLLLDFNLPERFIKKILSLYNISDGKKCAEISKTERTLLVKNLTEYQFGVSRLASYDVAMATKGGIKLNEINSKTMESKLIKGLYFAGEVLDIDGNTGGYNIQAAASMGVLAVSSIKF